MVQKPPEAWPADELIEVIARSRVAA